MTFPRACGCFTALLVCAVAGSTAPPASEKKAADTSEAPAADDFKWRDLVEKTAVLSIENSTGGKRTLAISLADFGFLDAAKGRLVSNSEAGLQPIGAKRVVIEAGEILRLQLIATPPPDLRIRPAKYKAILLLSEAGKKPVARPVSVTVSGAEPLATEELQGLATRAHPFTADWETNLSVPLTAPVYAEASGLRKNAPIGVLRRDPGPGYALATWDPAPSTSPIAEVRVKLSGIEQPGNYKGSIQFAAGKSAPVAVLATDRVVYPIVVIVLGIVAGSFLKRWINVGRAVRLYKRDVAALASVFAERDAEFKRLTAGKSYGAFSIDEAFEKRRNALLGNVGTLTLSAKPLDQSNADYQKAVADLKDLQAVADGWVDFAGELRGLDQALDACRSSGVTRPAGETGPPAIVRKAADVLVGKVLSLAQFAAVRGEVKSELALAGAWLGLANRYLAALDLWQMLDRLLKADDPDRRLLEAVALNVVPAELWQIGDDGARARLDTALGRAEDLLDYLRQKITYPERRQPPQRDFGVSSREQAAAKRLELTIHFGDWLAFWIALVAGVLTALSTYYFGKPFGTFADYAAVFLWGVGTKAVVDLAALGIDKAVQNITRQAAAT